MHAARITRKPGSWTLSHQSLVDFSFMTFVDGKWRLVATPKQKKAQP